MSLCRQWHYPLRCSQLGFSHSRRHGSGRVRMLDGDSEPSSALRMQRLILD